jgi:hypothetical protein
MPLPFDERAVLCDKRRAVSHPYRLGLFAMLGLLTAAAAACDRPSDLPRKHDEILATVRAYQGRFDELKRRADDVEQRDRALPPATLNSAATQHMLAVARTTIDQSRAYTQQVPAMLDSWMKSGDVRELQKLLDAMRERLDNAVIEATSDLDAVESWTALAEQQPGGPRGTATPQPVPQPTIEDRNPTGAPVR